MNGMLNIYHLCHELRGFDCEINLLYATDEMRSNIITTHIGMEINERSNRPRKYLKHQKSKQISQLHEMFTTDDLQEPCNIQNNSLTAYVHHILHNNFSNEVICQNGVGGSVDGLLPVIFCFRMIENDVIYNLTVNQSDIRRYVEVIEHYTYFSVLLCTFWYIF